jgi:hypothetical protein
MVVIATSKGVTVIFNRQAMAEFKILQYIAGWLMAGLGLLAITQPTSAFTQTMPTEAFQGLPWGASTKDIQQRFSDANEYIFDACSNVEEAKRWRERNTSCKAMVISDYRIEKLNFTGTFFLTDGDQTLNSVVLSTTLQLDPSTPYLRPELMAKCKALRDLLSEKYGEGEWLSASNNPAVYLQRTRWNSGATIVDLTCRAAENEISMVIGYAPKFGLDSKKL